MMRMIWSELPSAKEILLLCQQLVDVVSITAQTLQKGNFLESSKYVVNITYLSVLNRYYSKSTKYAQETTDYYENGKGKLTR